MLITKKLYFKDINFYIIFFISLSVFDYILCQENVGDSNPTRNLEGELAAKKYDEGDINQSPEQIKDNFSFYD